MQATPLKVYRRSELQAVDDGCLFRFDQIWRKGVDDSSDIALIGIGFHSIKHRYILRLLEQHTPSDVEEARAAFEEGVVAVQTPSRLLPELRNLWDYHAEGFTLALDRFVAAEERSSSGSVTWAPDLVLAHAETSELEIKDDKSGWAPPLTEDELRGLFQARVYSYYGMQRWPGFHTYRFTINAIPVGEVDERRVHAAGARQHRTGVAGVHHDHRSGGADEFLAGGGRPRVSLLCP